jgi:hypothetical protein
MTSSTVENQEEKELFFKVIPIYLLLKDYISRGTLEELADILVAFFEDVSKPKSQWLFSFH